MPLYDFRCQACGKTWEAILDSWKSRGPRECPACHARRPERLFPTGVGFRLLGPGFHVNDYASPERIRDVERNEVVAVTPEEQHHRRRRGIKP